MAKQGPGTGSEQGCVEGRKGHTEEQATGPAYSYNFYVRRSWHHGKSIPRAEWETPHNGGDRITEKIKDHHGYTPEKFLRPQSETNWYKPKQIITQVTGGVPLGAPRG